MSDGAIYAGDVVHVRHRPRAHRLRYRVFSLLLDLDRLEALDKKLKLFSYNRFGVFSFRDADHGDGEAGGLRRWAERLLADAGIAGEDLKIEMLCYPRIFGYVFNPITVYFCSDAQGMRAILYEVCNTFYERHTYVIPVSGHVEGAVRQSCAKELYVSPFVPMQAQYDFKITPPSDKVQIAINESDNEGALLYAAFTGRREELSEKSLARALLRYPLMTLKIMGGIHWEALKLWLKGNPVFMHEKGHEKISHSVIGTAPAE
ncbi:DUF1365 domain-containing protein [Pelagibacterium halotolerans]|uniref:DUF1365 domain-containing protein n=1 Tax=Pelagibacterium halotolerans (strain DSM 22347 / JCM 15775 / CGMCC 1.7692 / B2) TaxID=1082931 RepID=G4RAL6_PELHB|nr:DUF1365 domain-containing protein [Pelagibacterium halotolerans]AEQ52539.1 hypothetical protein KKY_2531 [Pelagibacterium halotolerans B2]QJR17741.1 DUF1365 domain-containing protein [Pelagibacterium halotolerans]SEA39546.1 hypothetical protein SAMN05428936_103280 [Pelagibacterium halotolerans]